MTNTGEPIKYAEVITGEIVCIPCTLQKEVKAKSDCKTYGHSYGLKTDDGKLWSMLINNRSKELLSEKYTGKKVEIIGKKITKAQYIDLYSFKEIPEQKAQQSSEVKVAYVCPDHPMFESANQGVCPKCGKILEKRVFMNFTVVTTNRNGVYLKEQNPFPSGIIYTCLMHPEVTSDKPGKCPKCGMKLIKK